MPSKHYFLSFYRTKKCTNIMALQINIENFQILNFLLHVSNHQESRTRYSWKKNIYLKAFLFY